MYRVHHANGFLAVASTAEAAVREAKERLFITDAKAKEMLEALNAGAKSQTATYGFAQTTITLA